VHAKIAAMKTPAAIAATLVALLALPAQGAAPSHVVELFTSQGCSSCPPADALLGEYLRKPGVLALAYHVQYWDELGWRDRFGLSLAAERQSRYVRTLRLPTAFTPQVIVDGTRSALGSSRREIDAALGEPRAGAPSPAALEARMADGEVQVDVAAAADGRGARDAADVLLVSYLPQADSAIGRGENSGRSLREFNIVRAVRVLGDWRGAPAHFHVAIGALPADATHAAILVQGARQGPILAATSIALR
jgi:hypothetical protein